MSYRLLALDPNSRHMSLAVLRKIRDLVERRARPSSVPSRSTAPAWPTTRRNSGAIAAELWGRQRRTKARSSATRRIAEALASDRGVARLRVHQAARGHEPRVRPPRPTRRRSLLGRQWQHPPRKRSRRASASRARRPSSGTPRPGSSSRRPISSPTGARSCPCGSRPMTPSSWSSARRQRRPPRALPDPVETDLAAISGPWDVAFQPGRGAPATARLEELVLVERERRSGSEVFLRNGHLFQDHRSAGGVV